MILRRSGYRKLGEIEERLVYRKYGHKPQTVELYRIKHHGLAIHGDYGNLDDVWRERRTRHQRELGVRFLERDGFRRACSLHCGNRLSILWG